MRIFVLVALAVLASPSQTVWSDERDVQAATGEKSPIHAALTGKKKSDRVFMVELLVAAQREVAGGGRQSQQMHSTVFIPDGQTFELGGGWQESSDSDGDVTRIELSFRVGVSSLNKETARVDAATIHRISSPKKKGPGSRTRIITLEGIEDVPLGKSMKIDLGNDKSTGFKYTVSIGTIREEKPTQPE